jgi:hypothetical protein
MRRALLALTAIVTVGSTAAVGTAADATKGFALHPVSGVGPVSLGETKGHVERVLHQRTGRCQNCLRKYPNRRGNLFVRFANGRVSAIETFSSQVTLDGIPLDAGPKRLRRAGALRHWQHVTNCGGNGVQTYVRGTGPAMSIAFGGRGAVDVEVTPTGFGGCGGQ